MLERFLGQLWVTITAFIVGPAILFWLFWRRRSTGTPDEKPDRSRKPARDLPVAAAAQAPRAPAEVAAVRKSIGSGFRGVGWGQPPAEGMRLVHEEGESRFFERSGDELLIGTVQLSSVVYSFRLDRLEAVVIGLSAGGFELLTRHLTAEWGPPRSSADRTRHAWTDPGDGPEDSQAVLEKMTESRTARLVISSRAALAGRGKS